MTPANPTRRTRRRIVRWMSRADFYPRLEIGLAVAAILLGLISYGVLTGERTPANGFSPATITLLIVANLVPLMALAVLIARRLAILLTNRREGRAGARMHVRLVALFSAIAAVPTLLVVAFALLLFQFGVQFWFSDRAKAVLSNADRVAQAYVQENKQRIIGDIRPMAADMASNAQQFGIVSKDFGSNLDLQVIYRGLTEAAVFSPTPTGYVVFASSNMDKRPIGDRLLSFDVDRARTGDVTVLASPVDRVEALVRIDPFLERYLYVSRKVDPQVLAQVRTAATASSEYRSLIERSRGLQWRFFIVLFVVSLLILAAAIWFALWLANRLVAPIGRLVGAAERVGSGDFAARVPIRGSPDELGVLARTFNRMTAQLQMQQTALITANNQLDQRREFMEAVLSGVSAGVMSLDRGGVIKLANRSAAQLLAGRMTDLSDQSLAAVAPALTDLFEEAIRTGHARGHAELDRSGDTQTLAVQMAGDDNGVVVTFDDISQQLADQRRAAWSDVARRIAHEIKNPLTPIQLSAERLQRKYARQVTEDPETFSALTSTIVRQVGDLRRMVDEFSSFARMPKPEFRSEPIAEIIKQALFLQEVGDPGIRFEFQSPDSLPPLICDRRQIAQALTNLLKNAAEAVNSRPEGAEPGHVRLSARADAEQLTITITDNGIGLPIEHRDRITEPYVTTRARGTGLGLAIVKKIVEEHGGTLELGDVETGGTSVRIGFDLKRNQQNRDLPEPAEPTLALAAGGAQG